MTSPPSRPPARLKILRDRKAVAVAGMGMALLAGLAIAWMLMARDRGPHGPPPASQGGLVVQTGRDEDLKLDPRRPLRCFVNGQLVGELTVSDCAARNGVASGALDVGLDPSGALAASNGASSQITPLPPSDNSQPGVAGGTVQSARGLPPAANPSAGGRPAACWRYGAGEWIRLPEDLPLGACMSALYSGLCSPSDAPAYGRWSDRTLRLVDGRIEISADNRNFRVLFDRNPGCGPSPYG